MKWTSLLAQGWTKIPGAQQLSLIWIETESFIEITLVLIEFTSKIVFSKSLLYNLSIEASFSNGSIFLAFCSSSLSNCKIVSSAFLNMLFS